MGNNIYNIRDNDLTYGRGYVYSLQYHIVWCTKYRKQVLKDGVDEDLKKMLVNQKQAAGILNKSKGRFCLTHPWNESGRTVPLT